MTDDRRISDEEAREIWRHAARLQGAAERAEARDRLAPGEDAAVVHDPSSLPVEQVVAAATEAGISADHVLFALAERRLVDWKAIRPERWTTRWLRRLVGPTDAVEVSRFVRASPSRVLAAASLAGAWSGAVLGLLLGGGIGVRAFRRVYAWAVTKGDSAVRRLAFAIAAKAERAAT